MTEQVTADWKHSHALTEDDVLVDTQYDDGPFSVETIHDNGDVTLYHINTDDFQRHPETHITGALAEGNYIRAEDGKSHELATY